MANWFRLTQEQNPFSKLNYEKSIGALGSVAGQLGGNLIGGGYDADGVGSGIANIGGGIGSAISTVNPLVGGIVSAGSGIIGGLANRAFGIKTNQEALDNANNNISYLSGFRSNAGSFDGIQGLQATSNFSNPYKGGWFSGGKAKRKNQLLRDRFIDAKSFADRSIENNIGNLAEDQINNSLATYAAMGGPLNTIDNNNMGAIEYGFMSDWLANKRAKEDRLKDNANSLIGEPLSTLFANGGKIEIKHPGRLTALKKRTGKTEAELWAEGKPEVRKMITFARNSRRWSKHALGGYLKGNVYDIPEEEINRLIAAGYEVEYL